MTSKSELRRELRYRRQNFVLNNKTEFPEAQSNGGALHNLISRLSTVALYHATPVEPDTSTFATAARAHGVTTALPWLPPALDKIEARSQCIVFRLWDPGDPLIETALGFAQPREDAPIVTPDLILTPLVGFDRALNRLGQGAGHYDRAFESHPDALRVGVAWSVQEVDRLPVDDWDIPLDAILTEKEWIVRPGSRIAQETRPKAAGKQDVNFRLGSNR